MLREQIEDLTAEIKQSKRERDFAPLVVLGFAFFAGFLNGENVWGHPNISVKEAFLGVGLLVVIYCIQSIKIAVLQKDLRSLSREYWGPGPKAPSEEEI